MKKHGIEDTPRDLRATHLTYSAPSKDWSFPYKAKYARMRTLSRHLLGFRNSFHLPPFRAQSVKVFRFREFPRFTPTERSFRPLLCPNCDYSIPLFCPLSQAQIRGGDFNHGTHGSRFAAHEKRYGGGAFALYKRRARDWSPYQRYAAGR